MKKLVTMLAVALCGVANAKPLIIHNETGGCLKIMTTTYQASCDEYIKVECDGYLEIEYSGESDFPLVFDNYGNKEITVVMNELGILEWYYCKTKKDKKDH